MKAIIKFSADWADEFNCEQFLIVDGVEAAREVIHPIVEGEDYIGFGTNEGWEAGELDFNDFSVVLVEDELAADLEKIFGKYAFGVGPL